MIAISCVVSGAKYHSLSYWSLVMTSSVWLKTLKRDGKEKDLN